MASESSVFVRFSERGVKTVKCEDDFEIALGVINPGVLFNVLLLRWCFMSSGFTLSGTTGSSRLLATLRVCTVCGQLNSNKSRTRKTSEHMTATYRLELAKLEVVA